jgi:N-acetylglucosaminyldiphosphoundecaprenol N-acetyl-beta-D-mannosaminyltransferase
MLITNPEQSETTVATVDIIGIPMYAGDIPGVVRLVQAVSRKRATGHSTSHLPYCISATGAHGLVFAQKDQQFRQTLQNFYLNLPDGKPGVWVGRMKGAKAMQRCYGPDFFAALMQATAADHSIRHYLCGGQLGVAEQLQIACRQKFGNDQIMGTHSPPFRTLTEDEFRSLGEEMNHHGVNIVWIGISTPKQELFAAELAKYTKADFIITVGAAFDFYTGRVRQAPKWIQQAGLEWRFRRIMEPKRLYRRYLEIVPAFIAYNIRDMLKGKG